MLQNSTYSQPEFQQLVATLAKLQGRPKAGLMEVVEKEFDFLTNKVKQINQARKLKISSIKRKMENLAEESSQVVVSAQNFAYQIEKSLKQSERQCLKRIERLQRDRLQKQIEIKTIIDQQVLAVVEQSKMTTQLGLHFKKQNQAIQNINLQVQLWFSEIKHQELMKQPKISNNDFRHTIPNILKEKTQNINHFRKRANKIFKSLQQRLQKMKAQNQKWERQTLKQIQEIVENLVIKLN